MWGNRVRSWQWTDGCVQRSAVSVSIIRQRQVILIRIGLRVVHSGRCTRRTALGPPRMATLPEQFSSRPEQQYATLLEVSTEIAAHQRLTECFRDLRTRL